MRQKIFLTLAAVVLVFFLGEIGLRLFWEMAPSVRRPFYRKSADPFIRYELMPDAADSRIKINSLGLRGPQITLKKPANTFRVLLLGDSELFSYLLEEKYTLRSQLEGILNSNSKGIEYQVINTGVEGYNTFQELEVLKTKGLQFFPDLVILNYVLNDPEPAEYYFGDNFFSRHSAVYRYILYRIKKGLIRIQRKRLKIKTELDHFNYLHNAKSFRRLKGAILEMADILKARDIRFMINIFPTSSLAVKDFKDNYPYRHIHDLIKTITHKNIITIDSIDEFNRLGMSPQEVSINYEYNESHKNPKAIGVMAAFIAKAMAEKIQRP